MVKKKNVKKKVKKKDEKKKKKKDRDSWICKEDGSLKKIYIFKFNKKQSVSLEGMGGRWESGENRN